MRSSRIVLAMLFFVAMRLVGMRRPNSVMGETPWDCINSARILSIGIEMPPTLRLPIVQAMYAPLLSRESIDVNARLKSE